MKHKKNILIGAFLLLALSCTDTEVAPSSSLEENPEQQSLTAGLPMGPKARASADGRIAVMPPLNTISTSTLASAINANLMGLKKYKLNPGAYTRYQSGVPYVNLGHVIGNPVFAYPSHWNAIMPPSAPAVFPFDAVKAFYSNQLNQVNVSPKFKSTLLGFYDVVRNIDSYTYRSFMNSIGLTLYGIANQQRGQPGGLLTAIEQFSLTQAFYHIKYLTESSYNSSSAPCFPQTREEWKSVAEAAFVTGLGVGAKLAWEWAIAGAIAAPPNPIVGGIVGAAYGFVAGFIGGSLMGGGVHIMANCIVNKLFNPMQVYTCGGTTNQFGEFRSTAMPPVGCITAYTNNMQNFPQIPMVPNLGATTISPNVVTDLNWLLSYL